jgi:hypothetical protein
MPWPSGHGKNDERRLDSYVSLESSTISWAGWGWALWNFRGEFGILDSEREDVEYEEFLGHKLDRELLSLLQSYR